MCIIIIVVVVVRKYPVRAYFTKNASTLQMLQLSTSKTTLTVRKN